jgi:protoporphyrinogen oxidase
MNVAVLGGGFSGLYAAHRLAGRARVEVFEASSAPGGLAGPGADGGGFDRYYHFICRTDGAYLALLDELGLKGRLAFRRVRTGQFCDDRLHPFSTPLDLLGFSPVRLPDRLRFVLGTFAARNRKEWLDLDRVPARRWLEQTFGRKGYDVIWAPLLRAKFGPEAEEVSAAWIWHRIHRVTRSRRVPWARESFAALHPGTAVALEALAGRLEARGGRLRLSAPVERIAPVDGRWTLWSGGEAFGPYDALLSTLPLPVLGQAVEAAEPALAARLGAFKYLAVRCAVLRLKRPASPYFWINVNDPRVPFAGVIELSHLHPPGPFRLVYLPAYLAPDDPLARMPQEEFLARCLEPLPRILDGFDPGGMIEARVFGDRYAQPVCTVGTGAALPPIALLPGLFAFDSFHLYPEDRTLNGMIGVADRAVAALAGDQ